MGLKKKVVIFGCVGEFELHVGGRVDRGVAMITPTKILVGLPVELHAPCHDNNNNDNRGPLVKNGSKLNIGPLHIQTNNLSHTHALNRF